MHPILYRFPESLPLVGGWPIRSFSVMVLIGVLCAAWWIRRTLFGRGEDDTRAFDHFLRNVLLLGFLGARITYLVVHPEHYENLLSLIAIWEGGIVSYGGFFGGALGAWLFARRWHVPFARVADAGLPALALGQAFGRVGCLLVGDDHGAPWDGPWAITFSGEPESLIPPELVGVPLHPSQIYLSLMNLAIFVAMAGLYLRRRHEGQVAGWTMILYAVGRFGVEMTRGDDLARGYWGELSTSQWISLPTLALGVLMLVRLRSRPVSDATPARAAAGDAERERTSPDRTVRERAALAGGSSGPTGAGRSAGGPSPRTRP